MKVLYEQFDSFHVNVEEMKMKLTVLVHGLLMGSAAHADLAVLLLRDELLAPLVQVLVRVRVVRVIVLNSKKNCCCYLNSS